MLWRSVYCLEVTVHNILTELRPLKIFVTISFPANSSYSLHPIDLKLDIYIDHDVEQRRLLRGYSPPSIIRFMHL